MTTTTTTTELPLPRAEDVKIIMTDVDGTFITDAQLVHDRTRSAIQFIRTHHPTIPIIVATGKHRSACDWFIRELGFEDSPAASCHGAVIHGPYGKVVSSRTLTPLTAWAIVEAARKLDRTCFLFTPEQVAIVYAESSPKRDWLTIMRKIERELVDGQGEEYWSRIRTGELAVIKATIPVEESAMAHVQSQFRSLLFEAHLELSLITALPFVLELVPSGINKSVALDKFCDQFGCKPENVVAFGDGMNDVEMLSEAGCGVAMENAHQVVKSAAKFSTLSNNEGGVGVFLDRIFRP
ncbi:hypothetical protein CROQUDRAFT_659812 [Cronartium quercuum f. sp. fusiforme G11]|uniref:Haloacid dehalogenase-like hydrolase n=1 Tax=Cronartium quercuum f. sp. fusiforme G11 TaxID=708437 RepID=A0A9P6TAH1_9BASI|nr:hypothetical protein CROQUDRAFT_659812 [Cronartium quercuum f. sp. fusiforme G11]